MLDNNYKLFPVLQPASASLTGLIACQTAMLPCSIIILVASFLLLPPDVSSDITHPCPLPLNFHCRSGECILKTQQCDGRNDCSDRSDENNCGESCNAPKWWRCNDGVCVDALFRCDGETECPDKSDELHCSEDYKQDSLQQAACSSNQFQCSDGECISKSFLCNGEEDCQDGSDEDCLDKDLPCQGFKCLDGTCINKSWRCDGTPDCKDGSDERNCIPPIEKCHLNIGFFACGDNRTCIHSQSLCNGYRDCPDGSDEGGDCHVAEKNCLRQSCTNGCMETPKGPKCLCPPGLELHNITHCTDINECLIHSPCTQTCVNTLGSYHCECRKGYSLMNDNHTCRPMEEEPLMVFNTRDDVRAYYLEKEKYFSVAGKANQAVGVAFDGKYVYWTQLLKGSEGIVKSFLNGTHREVIVTNGLISPEDISVDWLTGNLYFTDSEVGHIAVCSNDGLHCTELLRRNIQKPRAVAVHSNLGTLFWTDWLTPSYIGRANMDGSEDVKLITENIRWPNGLCIDYQASKIYWVDGHFSKIESANFDGLNRKVALENVHHPYWVDIYGDTLYWSDWATLAVQSCNKETGKDRKTLVKANQVFGIQVYYPGRWNKTSDHSCSHTRCTLCLLKGPNSYTCACPVGKELAKDQFSCIETSHHLLLLIAGGSLFFTVDHQELGKHNVIVKDTPFQDITSIVYDKIKDRAIVYDDSRKIIYSVEKYREDRPLVRSLLDNDIGQIEDMDFDYRTNTLYWCDTYHGTIEVMNLATRQRAVLMHYHHGDVAIDLALVPEHGFMFVAFRTMEGTIHISKIGMDGKGQLVVIEDGYTGPTIKLHYDHESEQVFISDSGSSKIDVIHYTGMGHRLFRELRGDPMSIMTQGKQLFWTNMMSTKLYWTDKSHLRKPVDRKISIELPEEPLVLHIASTADQNSYTKPHECLVSMAQPYDMLKYPCSHVCVQSDISDTDFAGSVGAHKSSHRCLCPPGMVLNNDMKTCEDQARCTEQHFLCAHSNLCVDKSKRCDGVWDCFFNEDEIGCTGRSNSNCTNDQFQCKNGQCIGKEYFCDKHPDCSDKSDEDNCENYGDNTHCDSHQYQCLSGHCLDRQLTCDGTADCPNGDDESNCPVNHCKESEFRCASSRCVPKHWECDQSIDCDDGSDEHNRCAYRKSCDVESFRCGNGRCIEMSLRCNDVDDCRDGTDEAHCVIRDIKTTDKEHKKCEDDEYTCQSNTTICLNSEARCNDKKECPHGEDEMGCEPCPENQWQCAWKDNVNQQHTAKHHGQCIMDDWVCDGSFDCLDGSDEDSQMCKDRMNNASPSHVELAHQTVVKIHDGICSGKYRCKSGECVDFALLCNGEPNCVDGSDEGGLCKTSCINSLTCADICLRSPKGAICQCKHGFVLGEDGHSCEPAPPACSSNPCSQICQNAPNNTYICLCFPGYQLRLDRRSCKAVGGPMSLVYAVDDEIRRYIPSNNSVQLVHKHSLSNDKITGLDVYSAKNSVLFSLRDVGQIHHVDLITGNETFVSDLGSPGVLAVDWVTENVYFVDNMNSTRIRVCHMDRQTCATLINSHYGQIPALAVDPINKLMFYCTTMRSHDNTPFSYIYKANLDGTHIQQILSNLEYCGGLALDYDRHIVYVTDQEKHNIWLTDYEGKTRHSLSSDLLVVNPKNVQFFEDHMYFVAFNDTKLLKCDTTGRENCKYLFAPVNGADFMRIDQINKQRMVADTCANVNCANLCVMAPLGPRCICPDGEPVEPSVACKKTDEKQGYFSTVQKSSPNIVTSSRSSAKSVAAVMIIFTICFAILASYVYFKKYKQKKGFSDSFRVHFSPPSLSTIVAPFASIGVVASKIAASRKAASNDVTEYENPLHAATHNWPKDVPDATNVDIAKPMDPNSPLVPNLLMDSDSDVESERDLHEGEFRDKRLLIP